MRRRLTTEERRAPKALRINSPLGPSESTETRRLNGLSVGLYSTNKQKNKIASAYGALSVPKRHSCISAGFSFQPLSHFSRFRISAAFAFQPLSHFSRFLISAAFSFQPVSHFSRSAISAAFAFQPVSHFSRFLISARFSFQPVCHFSRSAISAAFHFGRLRISAAFSFQPVSHFSRFLISARFSFQPVCHFSLSARAEKVMRSHDNLMRYSVHLMKTVHVKNGTGRASHELPS